MPLFRALVSPNLARLLIERYGADFNHHVRKKDGCNPILAACAGSFHEFRFETMIMLLQHDVCCKQVDASKRGPLYIFLESLNDYLEECELHREPSRWYTPAYTEEQQRSITENLLERGAGIGQDKDGMTPLSIACEHWRLHFLVPEILRHADVDVSLVDNRLCMLRYSLQHDCHRNTLTPKRPICCECKKQRWMHSFICSTSRRVKIRGT